MIPLKYLSSIGVIGDWRPTQAIGVTTLALALISPGCGREAADSTAVAPPGLSEVQVDAGSESSSETPEDSLGSGGLELPEVEIPAVPATDEPATDEPAASGGIEMPKDVVVPDDAGVSSSPAIKYGDWEEIESLARSTGRVTVVDLWSLACEPCLKEFPGLVRLHKTQGSRVQCIAVDLDYDGRKSRPPEHYENQVLDFLRSVGADGFPTYISKTPSDDVFAANKLASIPAVMVFDADGEIAKVFVDAGDSAGFTYEKDVVPLVAKLVE